MLEPAIGAGVVGRLGISHKQDKKAVVGYQNDPHARYGIIPIEKYRSLYSRKPDNVYSLLALERLGMISL